MELSSALHLEMLGKPFLLEKRIVLLHAIEEYGSISKAAKSVPMAYKSAWEAVDMMNSLSAEPIVCRETGGKYGGGTTITAYGKKLLENYALLKEEHTRFIERLSSLTDVESGAFKTIERLAMQVSARNQIQARIIAIEAENVNAKVFLKLKSGQVLVAIITREALENLEIGLDDSVIAIFKSSAVCLSLLDPQNNKENVLTGSVVSIDVDDTHAKVLIDMGNHDMLAAVLSLDVLKALGLKNGTFLNALVESKNIMIGK